MSTESAVVLSPVSSLTSRFKTGIVFNVIGAVFNQGSTLFVSIIVAHLLGRHTFGEYAMVQSTLATLGLVAQVGTGYTATKYVAEFRSTDRKRAGRILGMLLTFSAILSALVAITLLFVAPWLAGSVLEAPRLGLALAIGSIVLVFAVLNGLLMGALSGLESYRALATALVWSGVIYTTVCAILAWWGGLNGAVGGLAVSGLAQFILLFITLRRECALHGIELYYTGFVQEWGIISKFAVPSALTGFTSAPALWLANAFLVRQSDGYRQLAIYSASFSLITAVLFLPNLINNVGMSVINNHKGLGAERDYRRSFWMNLGITFLTILVAASFAGLLGPELLRLFGKSFKDGYPTLLILLIATVPQSLAVALYQIIQSQAKMWLSFLTVALPRDTLLVGLAYWLVRPLGAKGAALAYTISWVFALLVITAIVMWIGLNTADRQSGKLTVGEQPSRGLLLGSQARVAFWRALRAAASKLTPSQQLRDAFYKTFLFCVKGKTMLATVDGMRFQLDLGEVIDASLLLGRYEPDVVRIIQLYCQPGWTILDIGANIGAHTLRFAKVVGPEGAVYAFEPTDYAYAKLVRNLSLNAPIPAQAFQLALADKNLAQQSVDFRSSWPSDGRWVRNSNIVDFVRLDDWCEEHAIKRIDCIKIDTDGNEGMVLRGAQRLLRRFVPLIILEVGAWHFRRLDDNPLVLLRDLGYQFWDAKTLTAYSTLESIHAELPPDDGEMSFSINVMAWSRFPSARNAPSSIGDSFFNGRYAPGSGS